MPGEREIWPSPVIRAMRVHGTVGRGRLLGDGGDGVTGVDRMMGVGVVAAGGGVARGN